MTGPLGVVLGTRPEIIKMAPVIRSAIDQGHEVKIIHTGQHYSEDMDGVFLRQLGLPPLYKNLGVGSATPGVQLGKMMAGLEAALSSIPALRVLVHGDTNTTASGALISTRLQLWTGHVEAGLRSFDRKMPEEHNRILCDHLCDVLYAPTDAARRNLLAEGLPASRITVTGNTVVDAVLQNRELAKQQVDPLGEHGLQAHGYILMTVHRQENVDDRNRFRGILDGARRAATALGLVVIYPIHPRARKMLGELQLSADGIRLLAPQDYFRFLELQAHAALVLTDSGGLQEEACVLRVPCVTVRDNTERPETVEVGANRLAGTEPSAIAEACQAMVRASRDWVNPFGDGRAGERIVRIHMEA